MPYETLQALALSYHIPFFSCQFHFTLFTLLLCLLVLHNTYEDRQNKENREATSDKKLILTVEIEEEAREQEEAGEQKD